MGRAGILLTLIALALGACGGSEDEDAPTPDLAGRSFVSDVVRGHALAPRTVLSLAFEPGRLSAEAGCNTLAGGWSIDGGRLRTGELAATQIGCEPALAAQDEWLRSFLAGAPRIALDGDALTLTGDGVAIELRESAPAGPPPIVGTTWRLTTIGERGGSVSNVPAGVEAPTLRIEPDGRVELFAGCNSGGGTAEVRDDGFVVFGPLALTRMACDDATMRVEATLTAILDGRVAAGFSGEGDLSLARDGRHLLFTAS
jgi:heat shock protein HslJ